MREDRERWDQRYGQEGIETPDPDPLLVTNRSLLESGTALDLACGRGGNALFLAEHGYRVYAMDISSTALVSLRREAVRRGLPVQCIVADLEDYPLPAKEYDLVTVFYFFDAALMTAIAAALRPAGLLFYATFNHRHTSLKPGFNPAYLVPRGGLKPIFPGLEILLDEPETGDHGNIAQLIARKPAQGQTPSREKEIGGEAGMPRE
jgi:tellurite methyltransferase